MGWWDTLLDATVVASFSRAGFERHARDFEPFHADLTGQVIAITGGNRGLGKATARLLGPMGAELVLLCRSVEAGEDVAASIREAGGRARAVALDLADRDAIASVAERGGITRLDALVHNAGVMPETYEQVNGMERTLWTHLVGPVLLSRTLRPLLEQQPGARMIWVSSGGGLTQKLEVEALQMSASDYDPLIAYARTKRAQIELAEVMAAEWPAVHQASMHPGWADTPGVRSQMPRFFQATRGILRSPEQGADTIAWLAAARRGRSGCFWFDRREASTHPIPGTATTPEERAELWDRVNCWVEALGC